MTINVDAYNIVDCEWNEWIHGTCSKPCGGGTRNNTREERVPDAYGGKPCEGAAAIDEPCNIQECPGQILFFYNHVSKKISVT